MGMEAAHCVKLNAALNYSVLLFEGYADTEQAIFVAKKYYDAGVEGLSALETSADMERSIRVLETIKYNVVRVACVLL